MLYSITLLLNVMWFAAGFRYFGWKRATAAKLLVPRSARQTPVYVTLTAALPFLAGMNFAWGLLAGALLLCQDLFVVPLEQAVLLFAFSAAHLSQFIVNIPVAWRGGRIDESWWDVLRGPMLFIFGVDAVLGLLNLILALGRLS